MKTVFIGGCDRSGTTLLASMLGCATGAIVTPESQFKYDILDNFEHCKHSDSLWRLKMWGISYSVLTDYVKKAKDGKLLLQGLVYAYAKSVGADSKPLLWIDHTPANIRNVISLAAHFQDAKFVHIIRDGRAVATSVMPLEWGPNNILDAADWWLGKLSFGLAACSILPNMVKMIKYEALVEHPERELRNLCAFLDIEYSEKMPTGQGFRVPGYTRKQHVLVGRRPDVSRLYAWSDNLTAREVGLFEFKAGEMLRLMEYEVVGALMRRPSRWERFVLWLKRGHLRVLKKKLLRKVKIRLAKMEN